MAHALAFLLWLVMSVSSISASDQVIFNDVLATSTTTADPSVVSHYKQVFVSQFPSMLFFPPRSPGIIEAQPCTYPCADAGCCQADGRCLLGSSTFGAARTALGSASKTDTATTTILTAPSGTTTTLPSSGTWQSVPLPVTVLSALPTRETLYRTSTATSTTADHGTAGESQSRPSRAGPATSILQSTSNNVNDVNGLEDITSTYYTYTIDGHHPFVLPVIVEDATKTPLTLLAWADVYHTPSFISSSLVSQLGLTAEIDNNTPTSLTSEDLSLILKFNTSSSGTLYLDLLAGVDDRPYYRAPLIVFEAATTREGPWDIDLRVGMDFLIHVDAIRISSEYIGAGARVGLGIVVQRVFESEPDAPAKAIGGGGDRSEHDEL